MPQALLPILGHLSMKEDSTCWGGRHKNEHRIEAETIEIDVGFINKGTKHRAYAILSLGTNPVSGGIFLGGERVSRWFLAAHIHSMNMGSIFWGSAPQSNWGSAGLPNNCTALAKELSPGCLLPNPGFCCTEHLDTQTTRDPQEVPPTLPSEQERRPCPTSHDPEKNPSCPP